MENAGKTLTHSHTVSLFPCLSLDLTNTDTPDAITFSTVYVGHPRFCVDFFVVVVVVVGVCVGIGACVV